MAHDPLSFTFFALADPTRRAILAQLVEGDKSVSELAAPFAITPRAVSSHLSVLAAAGLITRGRDAQRRPSRLRATPLADIDAWLDNYRALWTQRFNRLDKSLASPRKRTGRR